ncbi:MAG: cadmium-translocating P-type ATPase [Ruminococcaceae bacterium]|nr:cadmium-translocating P-type ATPase [Oscillospiraceae bacterium]
MTKKQKKLLTKIIVSGILFVGGFIVPYEWMSLLLFVAAYLTVGYSVIIKALKNIRQGQVFDENFLMLVATLGAFALREYSEAVAVMLFYQVGELFESIAVGRSRKSVSELINIVPEYANIMVDGELTQVMPEEVEVGDIIIVRTGEKIAIDGIIVSGQTVIESSALTGESVPTEAAVGDEVLSGCINLGSTIEIRTTKEFEDSTASKIMYLVEEASSRKAKTESFITKFARKYTPCVVIAAAVIALVPSLITGDWATWVSRALLFLVVSCPCALVISVPLTFFCSIGRASASGILIKGSNFLELAAKAEVAVFDKTGTLTEGRFEVAEIKTYGVAENELKYYLALAESFVDHPIARCIAQLSNEGKDHDEVTDVKQLPGFGVSAVINGKTFLAGNEALMERNDIEYVKSESDLTVVYAAVDGQFVGYVTVADRVKDRAEKAIFRLRKNGIKKTVMLTGDKEKIGRYVADKTGIDEFYAELLPDQKVERLCEIRQNGQSVIFVGDGLNDAPVLTEADIGIAMGALGSDAAIEAADIVIMDDDIEKVSLTVEISRKTLRIVRQNIIFALGIKFAIMLLGIFGFANMWMAVFADVGVSVIAILNALRCGGR